MLSARFFKHTLMYKVVSDLPQYRVKISGSETFKKKSGKVKRWVSGIFGNVEGHL
jgi:hypothetical protein